MSTALRERPVDLREDRSRGGTPARRAIVRWAWRLFRREWRQQILVVALVIFAVAATTVGIALASNVQPPGDANFGSASGVLNVPGTDRADIATTRRLFGPIEEIDDQMIPIPGSGDSVDLRAQSVDGLYSKPLLRLVKGRYPTGPREVAMTAGVEATLSLRIGDTWNENDQARRIVGTVENPDNLQDEFALVAPGQVKPPSQATIFFDAAHHKSELQSFQPTGGQGGDVGIGIRGGLNAHSTAAAAAILALETIGLLFVGLVAAAGFAVMAQRRLRALGMLGALGATDRQVRLAMVANGAVVGIVGAVIGAAVGLVSWVALAPEFESLAHHRVDVFHLPWWALGASMLLAVVTAIAAAWWPARSASRASIVTALSGRPAPPKPAHRFATLGAVLLAVGVFALAFAHRSKPNTTFIIVGTIATTFGLLFVGPLGIRALGIVGRRAPIALRLALRDLARYQARSAAALGAISLALAIAATVVVSSAALAGPAVPQNLPSNEAIVRLIETDNNVVVDGAPSLPAWTASQVAAIQARVDALAATLHAQAVIPLMQAVDPATGTVDIGADGPPALGPGSQPGPQTAAPTPAYGVPSTAYVPIVLDKTRVVKRGGHSGIEAVDVVPLYVATPALLHYFGIRTGDVDANADILTSRKALQGLAITAISRNPNAHPALPQIQRTHLPNYFEDPNTLLTQGAVRKYGFQTVAAGWLIKTKSPLTDAQVAAARRAAGRAGVVVATRETAASYTRLRNGATAVGLLVALCVLAMTVGLIRSETANDLQTLSATGATSTMRRTLTGATAGALALLGALIGTGGAYLALVAWHRSDLHPLTNVPFLNLAIIIVGLPAIAIGAGWLLAGREPSTIAHKPLE